MKIFVAAYDVKHNQILGNLDGQGIITAKCYKRTKHYKSLATLRTLKNLVSAGGYCLEIVTNTTCGDIK